MDKKREPIQYGVKYCGGCNPKYDRGAAVSKLKKCLPGVTLNPVAEGVEYDTVLLVCGCQVGCIREWRKAKAKRFVMLNSPEAFEKFE